MCRDARRARMKRIYPRTLNLNAAVADPRIMGVIREEGGRPAAAAGRELRRGLQRVLCWI